MADEITAKSFEEANERTKAYVAQFIDAGRADALQATSIDTSFLPHFEKLYVGKVRDMYVCRDVVVIVTCDRQSAFDRQLASVPYKGMVLNKVALWWFQQTADLVPNHVIASPHPNVTVARRCDVFPVEFVVRAYATGSTSTSLWTNYAKGVRNYCGHVLPDGLRKNERLERALLTPTTKSDEHDALISATEIVAQGLMTQADWDVCSRLAHELFAFGQRAALERGLILVDTKVRRPLRPLRQLRLTCARLLSVVCCLLQYEFGRDVRTGEICVLDEVHTPDSSRFWIAETYAARVAAGAEPDSVDKEFLRRWFVQHCDPYHDAVLPAAPVALVNELSRRYILLFETLTAERFPPLLPAAPLEDALRRFFDESSDHS